MGALSLVPDGEAPVAEEPGDGPLGLPAVPAAPFAGLDARPCDAWDDYPLGPGQVFGGEVRLVRSEFDQASPTGPCRERMAGMPRTGGLGARLSCMLAPVMATLSRMP